MKSNDDSQRFIPFVDLVALHKEIEDELLSVFRGALETAGFIGGPMVEKFENDFSGFCGVRHCVGVSSGTDAVRFALMAAGVQKDEIVVTVPNTFIATSEAISQAGARAAFVDVDEWTYNMDTEKLAAWLETECSTDRETGKPFHRKLRKTVSAIVPVHLYGQMADMDAILEIAQRYNLIVIEDACQAHGAEYFSARENRWRKAGSLGHAAAFSFYPGKNLGGCGEGGAVTTQNSEIARTIRMLRDHGQAKKYFHDIEGYNGRLDAIQAGVLSAKLAYLPVWNEKRRAVARRYRELLAPLTESAVLPEEPSWSRAVYHLYVVRVANRDELQSHLARAHVGTGIHYPIPLHLQKAYSQFGYQEGDFPVTEQISREIISLPMYPQLSELELPRITQAVSEFLALAPTQENGAVPVSRLT